MKIPWDTTKKYVWYDALADDIVVYNEDQDIWLKAFYKGDDLVYIGEL